MLPLGLPPTVLNQKFDSLKAKEGYFVLENFHDTLLTDEEIIKKRIKAIPLTEDFDAGVQERTLAKIEDIKSRFADEKTRNEVLTWLACLINNDNLVSSIKCLTVIPPPRISMKYTELKGKDYPIAEEAPDTLRVRATASDTPSAAPAGNALLAAANKLKKASIAVGASNPSVADATPVEKPVDLVVIVKDLLQKMSTLDSKDENFFLLKQSQHLLLNLIRFWLAMKDATILKIKY